MKVLFVNTTYNIGSTGKLTKNFLEYLRGMGHDVYCVYADGSYPYEGKGLKVKSYLSRKFTIFFERFTGAIGFFSPISTYNVCCYVKKVKPDIIYLGNLHGYYINIYSLYRFIRHVNIPCVQIMWDEFPLTGSCAFSYDCRKYESICSNCPYLKDYPISWFIDNSTFLYRKKKEVYEYEKIAFVSVPYTISIAKCSSLLANKRLIPLDEAVDLEKIYYPRNSDSLRKELKIPMNNKVVLTVADYPSERKGCKYFLELARLYEKRNDITFVHVGFMGDKSECPDNYIAIGFVDNQDTLAQYYSLADLFICTSFAETQPNTCLESLSCGTRICGFNISGIPTCAEEPFGKYVSPRDVKAMAEIVDSTPIKTTRSIRSTREYAKTRFSSRDYNERLFKIGMNLIQEVHEENIADSKRDI